MSNLLKSQKLSNDFSLAYDENGNSFIESKQYNLRIKTKKGGYVPKSGLLLADTLKKYNLKGRALDVGTGEAGFLAYFLYAQGATDIVACDIDSEAIEHAKIASSLSRNIKWVTSDVYSNIGENKFNNIVSNPPQMPMETKESLHDSGGIDGRDIIIKILKEGIWYLEPGGKIFLLCFDFLGVNRQYGPQPTIKIIAKKIGYSCAVVGEYLKFIRPGGKTEENIKWINNVYPNYHFQKNNEGKSFHKILILKLKLL